MIPGEEAWAKHDSSKCELCRDYPGVCEPMLRDGQKSVIINIPGDDPEPKKKSFWKRLVRQFRYIKRIIK